MRSVPVHTQEKVLIPTSKNDPSPLVSKVSAPPGLSQEEARRRLAMSGPNAIADAAFKPWQRALKCFCAPVPWMLEGTILLELTLADYLAALIICMLLLFNAALSLFQEGRAQTTLSALKSRLALNASVLRDGNWQIVPAAELVSGDVIKLSLGGIVPADALISGGQVLLDQSMLTGESASVESGPGTPTYAGALVRRGEALAEVTATGNHTKFGKTAELVRTAHVVTAQQNTVMRVVRNLALFNGGIICILIAYAYHIRMPTAEVVPLILTTFLASIPVALPATFTLAASIGASALAALGVLPIRLSAVNEAATINVLCVDKTGTLTRNDLTVTKVSAMPTFDVDHVLGLAALASADGGQDPVDIAIRKASPKNLKDIPLLLALIPFDPATKMSVATVTDLRGSTQRIVKGAFAIIATLAPPTCEANAMADEMEKQGLRVLAVAVGSSDNMRMAGLIGISDPPRTDSSALITELNRLGVRTIMVTGDAATTASVIAKKVGLHGLVCPPGPIPADIRISQYAVFAGVLPEEKYQLVKAFQNKGHRVGMCGDGANDAPALRQAQMGIAVSTATDIAKSAAGMVLTKPGLVGIVAAIKEGRATFQRIETYMLNSILKKIVTVLFLMLGLMITGHAILTPLLMVIVMIAGDFLAMSLTTDNVMPTRTPNTWRVNTITLAGASLGTCMLAFCTVILLVGKFGLALDIDALRTLAFLSLVFGSQAMIYAIRGHQQRWGIRPSRWLIYASAADLSIASALAIGGIAMAPLPLVIVFELLLASIALAVVLAYVKRPLFTRLKLA